MVKATYINRSSLQCTLAKFKNKCLLDLTFGAPPQTLQRGFWKGILFDIKSIGNLKIQNSATLPTKKAIFTLSSMALISFPQESHWSPLASWRRKKEDYITTHIGNSKLGFCIELQDCVKKRPMHLLLHCKLLSQTSLIWLGCSCARINRELQHRWRRRQRKHHFQQEFAFFSKHFRVYVS